MNNVFCICGLYSNNQYFWFNYFKIVLVLVNPNSDNMLASEEID